jgi:8-oxo-dGTP pyrophosphatase MutT (NUDIX family)
VLAGRDGTYWEAAVAIVLRPSPGGDLEMLFIKRATREGDPWSGQIALPGGKFDPTDTSLEHTAVRETREEVAIDLLTQGEVFGALDELRPRNPLLPPVIVRPFVAAVEPGVTVVPSEEVAEHFWAPLDRIFDPAALRDTRILVRGFHMRRDAIHYEGHVIWGMTQFILASFEQVAR